MMTEENWIEFRNLSLRRFWWWYLNAPEQTGHMKDYIRDANEAEGELYEVSV